MSLESLCCLSELSYRGAYIRPLYSKWVHHLSLIFLSIMFWFWSPSAQAQNSRPESASDAPPLSLPSLKRPTVQNRFSPRMKRFMTAVSIGAHIRDDYYSSLSGGLSAEYFINDTWGLGLSYTGLLTWLSDEANLLREGYGLVPDARPQSSQLGVSTLYGLGYGKMILSPHIVHFDPIFGLFLGVANAAERTIPTIKLSFMPTFLLKHELSIRFDLGLSLQLEQRSRGWVFSTGFMPTIALGWGQAL